MDKKKTAISLFSGAGGMDVGFEKRESKFLLQTKLCQKHQKLIKPIIRKAE